MSRRHKVDEINLTIKEVIPFINDDREGYLIDWSSDIGFGTYKLFRSTTPEDNQWWYGDSEFMDDDNDKAFIQELMRLFIENLKIVW